MPSLAIPPWFPAIRMADDKADVPRYLPLDRLSKHQYWQPNDHHTTWCLVVDIDSADWLLPLMDVMSEHPSLTPSWMIEKSSNGHGQLAWIIEPVSHGPASREHPQRYARAVREALTTAFGGDPAFTNARCWNPLWTGWNAAGEVWWMITAPRSLGTLRNALRAAGLWSVASPGRSPAPVSPADAPGRNCHIFDVARTRQAGTVEQAATQANDALAYPLKSSELAGIVRSIERWEARYGPPWVRRAGGTMTAEQIEAQRERGRKGRAVNSPAQQEQAAQALAKGPQTAAVIRSAEAAGRAAQIRALREAGMTRRQIAERLGVSEDTVKRAVRGG